MDERRIQNLQVVLGLICDVFNKLTWRYTPEGSRCVRISKGKRGLIGYFKEFVDDIRRIYVK
jgi:hypothetical protein